MVLLLYPSHYILLFFILANQEKKKEKKAMPILQRISFGTKVAIFLRKKTWKTKNS
jgi:preprotein translocase subunit YajC